MVLKKWAIIIFAPPGNCKSVEQARLSYKLVKEYYKIEKKYPQLRKRFLFTNQQLNPHPYFRFTKKNKNLIDKALGDGHIRYWNQPDDLRYCPVENCWKSKVPHHLHDCDLFCDEGANLFPATAKNASDDLPVWAKTMLAQHRHRSLRIVLLTQDFMGINIAARRNTWEAWAMEKVIGSRDPSPSLPPVRFIWGLYRVRKIDPDLARRDAIDLRLMIKTETKKANEERDERMKLIGAPRFHWISRFKCSLFDTLADIQAVELKRELEHIEVKCGICGHVHRTHKIK